MTITTIEEPQRRVTKPHPKQWQLIQCPCNEILYGGAAGGGKTKGLAFDWIAHKQAHGKNAKGLMLRRTNPELEDMIRDLQMMFADLPNKPRWMESKRIFMWPDGAVLEMGYLESYDDVFRYIGREFNWLGWDELTLWPDDDAYTFLLTRMRSPHGVPIRVIATTNPGGPGHGWVMKRFRIDEYPHGNRVERVNTKLDDGRVIEWSRVFIPALLADNPTLDGDGIYRAQLMNQNEITRKKLLDGRWDVLEGAFFPEWDSSVHVVQHYTVPKTAKKWMAGDWGSSKPYCFLWFFEESNGDLVVYDELYGAMPGKINVGTRETISEVAEKIKQKERERGFYITERYLDHECWSTRGQDLTEQELFLKAGVVFQQAIKKNKRGGIEQVREVLKVVNGRSRLRAMDTCTNLIRCMPRIQTDKNNPDLYDTDGEDHPIDTLLYGVRRNIFTSDEIKAKHKSMSNRNRLQYQVGPYGLY